MSRIGIYSFLALILALAAYELLVRVWNEHRAKECDALIARIELHHRINGQYPKSLDVIGSQNSDDVCHYQLIDDGYIFVLGAFTLQTYEYNSETQKWRWD